MESSNVTLNGLWNRAAESWCRFAHPEPMWPIHGHYQCPKCLRLHRVRWDNPNIVESRSGVPAAVRQASARAPLFDGAGVAGRQTVRTPC